MLGGFALVDDQSRRTLSKKGNPENHRKLQSLLRTLLLVYVVLIFILLAS